MLPRISALSGQNRSVVQLDGVECDMFELRPVHPKLLIIGLLRKLCLERFLCDWGEAKLLCNGGWRDRLAMEIPQ